MNLENMVIGQDLSQYKNKVKKIFFYRVCGTGMGACACLAKEAGFEVAGADLSFSPPMSTYLESLDIPLLDLNRLTKSDLSGFDLIIVGNSVPRESHFAKFVEEVGKPFTSFPSFLGEFVLKDKKVIGISGTHGKTTSTYFLTQMLESLGERAGYFVGGIIDGRPPSRLGEGEYFIIEADEYDSAYFQKISKFRLYEMNYMILTSLEFDHADIFNSIEDIKDEFLSVIPSLESPIIANDDYKAIDDLRKNHPEKKWCIYGIHTEEGPGNIKTLNALTSFSLTLGDNNTEFKTNIVGVHNILNISSCLLLLQHLGFDRSALQESVKTLGLVKRRQEERGYFNKSLVIDDFAHHPKAITLTIEAIRARYPGKKITTVFEPISATARSSLFQNEFFESLERSDKVVIAKNALLTTVEGTSNLNTELIVSRLNKNKIPAFEACDLKSLLGVMTKFSGEENIFLILSNRTCLGLWESDFVSQLT